MHDLRIYKWARLALYNIQRNLLWASIFVKPNLHLKK